MQIKYKDKFWLCVVERQHLFLKDFLEENSFSKAIEQFLSEAREHFLIPPLSKTAGGQGNFWKSGHRKH